ncbi:uracil-DNA glycosylase family protein [Treponema parvum]|uniref:Uracil-DNA glycosylase family protein n=1 Tax=Treponema parvum TaxID=138851 RepID=A0A975F5I6_9SPIR|nr:uracil-DNA glycosylase family protein [Treponema parvum]QTQ14846.1 uracil-DNA glycosylase family protein [Treponema parvum]
MKPLLYDEIDQAEMNAAFREKGWSPLYTASPHSRIALIGQAPGRLAQETNKTWNDASGRLLRQWLGVTDEQFYNPDLFAIIPMDFYYPGKGEHGDLPPRKEFAATWHPKLLALMPDIRLTILIGIYAQKYYLAENAKQNLTENVKNFKTYLPDYFPLVHPSPINIFWRKRNPWFEKDVVPALQAAVKTVLT